MLNNFITCFVCLGIILGGLDYLIGNKLGIGEKFEEGLKTLSPLAMNMVGMICIVPLLAEIIKPVVIPVFKFLRIDPAMLGSILSLDMGGYQLATSLAENTKLGNLAGILLASTFGATLLYIIPMGLSTIEKEDHKYFAKGLLLGVIPIPFSAFIMGIFMKIPFKLLVINLLPIFIIVFLFILSLILFPEKIVVVFARLSRVIRIITTTGLVIGSFKHVTGLEFFSVMPPIMEAMTFICKVYIILIGCLPAATLIIKCSRKFLYNLGKKIGVNEVAIGSLVFSAVTGILVLKLLKDMNPKGKILSIAVLISTMGFLSGHLGFTMNVNMEIVPYMIANKVLGGVIAFLIIVLFVPKKFFD